MNHITIELCAEDRARLDRLIEAMERKTCDSCVSSALAYKEAVQHEAEQKEAPAEAPKTATEATKPGTLTTAPWEEETPTAKEDTPAEPVKPTVTLAQIQQKVVQLAAGFNGTKKAAVREIVNAYAQKVSDLPEDKWAEVWDKLTALESEG